MKEYCRLCMQSHAEMISIFSYFIDRLISDLINQYLPEISLNEKFSKLICRACFDILYNIDQLRLLSIENDKIQRSIITDQNEIDKDSTEENLSENIDIKIEAIDFVPICNTYTIPDNEVIDSSKDKVLRNCSNDAEKLSNYDSYKNRYFQCDKCLQNKQKHKIFRKRHNLEKHFFTSHDLHKDRRIRMKHYQCNFCLLTYMYFPDLTSHLYYVHNSECKRQNYIAFGKDSYGEKKLHLTFNNFGKSDKISPVNHFICDICDQRGIQNSFTVKAKLQMHILKHTNYIVDHQARGFFQCSYCDYSNILFDEYQSHMSYVHSKFTIKKESKGTYENKDEVSEDGDFKVVNRKKFEIKNKFVCTLCPRSCRSESLLIYHMRKVHKLGFQCLKCKTHFKSKKELTFHNNIHVDYVRELPANTEFKYECILCGFYSTIENDLYDHIPVHMTEFSDDANRILVCNNCSLIIKDYDSLHSHLPFHNEKNTHECLKCNNKKFPMGPRLLRHLEKHRVNEKLKCDFENCNFTCATRPQMRDHVKHKHHKEVVHLCPQCGVSFGQPGSLRNHIRNIHEKNNYIYQCSMCPMTFRVPSHLRNHQAVHTTEYNFKCDYPGCTKKFRAKRNLKLHQRFHQRETLKYKFPCEFCDRMFLTKDAVRRHSFTHTKIKPYICNVPGCDRAFSQSNDLNKHLRTHYHQEETYFCSYADCKQSFRLKHELRYHEGLHYQNGEFPPSTTS